MPILPLAVADAYRRVWSGSPLTPSHGGEIWQYDGQSWTKVLKADKEIVGFRSLLEFDDALYAATSNGPNGPLPPDKAYTSASPLDPPNDPDHPDKPGSTVNYEGNGSTVWRSYDGMDWTLKTSLDPGILAVGEIASHDGKTLLGTWGSGLGFEILELNADGTTTDLTPTFSDKSVLKGKAGVMELRYRDGFWYVGALDYIGGFALLRSADPWNTAIDSWEVITKDGFASEHPELGKTVNAYPWTSLDKDGVYIIGTYQNNRSDSKLDEKLGIDVPLDGNGQIWASLDGMNWQQVEAEELEKPLTYGLRTFAEWKDHLVIGTASNLIIPGEPLSPHHLQLALDEIKGSEYEDVGEDLALLLKHLPLKTLDIGGEVWKVKGPIIKPQSVPKPSSLWLLSSLLPLLLWRRRLGLANATAS